MSRNFQGVVDNHLQQWYNTYKEHKVQENDIS